MYLIIGHSRTPGNGEPHKNITNPRTLELRAVKHALCLYLLVLETVADERVSLCMLKDTVIFQGQLLQLGQIGKAIQALDEVVINLKDLKRHKQREGENEEERERKKKERHFRLNKRR